MLDCFQNRRQKTPPNQTVSYLTCIGLFTKLCVFVKERVLDILKIPSSILFCQKKSNTYHRYINQFLFVIFWNNTSCSKKVYKFTKKNWFTFSSIISVYYIHILCRMEETSGKFIWAILDGNPRIRKYLNIELAFL